MYLKSRQHCLKSKSKKRRSDWAFSERSLYSRLQEFQLQRTLDSCHCLNSQAEKSVGAEWSTLHRQVFTKHWSSFGSQTKRKWFYRSYTANSVKRLWSWKVAHDKQLQPHTPNKKKYIQTPPKSSSIRSSPWSINTALLPACYINTCVL